jgi:purine catabolism regulator
MPATVSQLLALGLLGEYEVLGEAALHNTVRSVRMGTALRDLPHLPGGALVALAADVLDAADVATELAIRLASSAGLAGLVLARPAHPPAPTTRALAARFGVPLVLVETADLPAAVAELDRHLHLPGLLAARTVTAALRRFPATAGELDGLLAGVESLLGYPVCLMEAEGRVIAGNPACTTAADQIRLAESTADRSTGRVLATADAHLLVTEPVRFLAGAPPNMWLAARLPGSAELLVETARQLLAAASWPAATRMAMETLEIERRGRSRALVLTRIIEHADAPRRDTVEQATALGWRLAGWHTAGHVATADDSDQPPSVGLVAAIEAALRERGVPADLVERSRGWAFWVTGEARPEQPDDAALHRSVQRALLAVERAHGTLRLCAGIGQSHQGVRGIRQSLLEAEQACMLARTRHAPAAVERAHPGSVGQLLASWRDDHVLRGMTADIVRPLLAADPSGDLVRTLGCYLDNESSATTTAVELHVHRNTVLHRLQRITALLPIDLANPDDRLAARLAIRLARSGEDTPPAPRNLAS